MRMISDRMVSTERGAPFYQWCVRKVELAIFAQRNWSYRDSLRQTQCDSSRFKPFDVGNAADLVPPKKRSDWDSSHQSPSARLSTAVLSPSSTRPHPMNAIHRSRPSLLVAFLTAALVAGSSSAAERVAEASDFPRFKPIEPKE